MRTDAIGVVWCSENLYVPPKRFMVFQKLKYPYPFLSPDYGISFNEADGPKLLDTRFPVLLGTVHDLLRWVEETKPRGCWGEQFAQACDHLQITSKFAPRAPLRGRAEDIVTAADHTLARETKLKRLKKTDGMESPPAPIKQCDSVLSPGLVCAHLCRNCHSNCMPC